MTHPCDPGCDVELCDDCDHAVDLHDLRAFDGICEQCDADTGFGADDGGPCSAANRESVQEYRQRLV